MMSLMVIAELKKRGVALQRIRRIVRGLRRRGYNEPLTQIIFGVSEREGSAGRRFSSRSCSRTAPGRETPTQPDADAREPQLSEIRARLASGLSVPPM